MKKRIYIRLFTTLAIFVANIPVAPAQNSDIQPAEIVIGIGERVSFSPTPDEKPSGKWHTENDNAAILSVKDNGTLTIIGMAEGVSSITSGKKRSISYPVRVVPKTIRILAIGNSFSEDAVQNYLYELARAEGIEIVVGNLFIGGCSLETHLANARSDAPAYSYRKIGPDGKLTTRPNTSLDEALNDESWNYISLQQVSYLAGKFSSWEKSLPQLIRHVREKSPHTGNTTLMIHQTWAYAENSTHKRFADYGKDQMKMYKDVVDCVSRVARLNGIDLVIPCGTAIQNGRTSSLGDTFCRDGFHLQRTYGRYTAACTWFEKIFNRDVIENPYFPDTISEKEKRIARYAAHYAVKAPEVITDMKAF